LCPAVCDLNGALRGKRLPATRAQPALQRMLVDCKRQEMEVFARRVTDFEFHTYLETVR
jgi:hypothetical protein